MRRQSRAYRDEVACSGIPAERGLRQHRAAVPWRPACMVDVPMIRTLTILALILLTLTSCGRYKRQQIQKEIDFFRAECIQTQDQEACLLYQEAVARMNASLAHKRAGMSAIMGATIPSPRPVERCFNLGNGQRQCY